MEVKSVNEKSPESTTALIAPESRSSENAKLSLDFFWLYNQDLGITSAKELNFGKLFDTQAAEMQQKLDDEDKLLVQLWILAERFIMPRLQNTTMRHMQKRWNAVQWAAEVRDRPTNYFPKDYLLALAEISAVLVVPTTLNAGKISARPMGASKKDPRTSQDLGWQTHGWIFRSCLVAEDENVVKN
ncbi:uncharacterized protein PAC_09177 [Phialocephala subalpina]|uniref:Uncharacterized protein n=1 Tax=Phialocephala subalpina TaxID=576137 RepID=A0A1L7X2N5_9HELO|nr:uncharacterized protein PAC_09177 [Phialocephala subalpina]